MQIKSRENPEKKQITLDELFQTEDEPSPEQPECRICLEPQEQDNKLIEPCQCSGSLNFVHQNCLKKWIKRILPQKENTIRCQLCGDQIKFQLQYLWECLDCEEFKKKQDELLKPFVVLVVTLMAVTGFLVFLFTLLFSSDYKSQNSGSLKRIQIIAIGLVIGASFIIKFVLWYMLCRQFMFKKSVRILTIQEKKKLRKKSKRRKPVRYKIHFSSELDID